MGWGRCRLGYWVGLCVVLREFVSLGLGLAVGRGSSVVCRLAVRQWIVVVPESL